MSRTERMEEPAADYGVVQKIIHWLMAIAIMLDLFIAQKFGNPMEFADRLESRVDHASLGTIVTVFFIVRIALRVKYGAPPLPDVMPQWQQQLAHIAHLALYVLIGALLLTGVATAMNAANPIALFGQFDITLGQINENRFDAIRWFHDLATEAIIVLIGLHVIAALYHGLVKRDGTTGRMMKFWRAEV